ncbi:tryptase-2-like [Girardinichthys multiradiatus]|uniref:tryptase-2-like n=1 Tax=Girardinichthys multiradiatus TaxID=208333 RepID=UPI001FAC2344|nr:tryptase-2-like [Girardinichthys multiradiatus]
MSETTFTNMGLDDGTDRSFSSSAECIKLQEFLAVTAPQNSISAMAVGKLIGVLVLLQCSAGIMGAGLRSSIIGGENAPKGKWPWLVYLNIKTDNGLRKWHCSGTIINNNWVLTAGRCWDDELWSRWDRTGVWVGTYELEMPSERYMHVKNVIRPNDFSAVGNGYVNDIALIQLSKTITFSKNVAAVRLPKEEDTFDSSSECWITGWGDVGKDPLSAPGILQQVKISILPPADCTGTYPDIVQSNNNVKMVCAGDPAGGKDACNGDYGDPLMCNTARGYVQVGIMSFGSPDGCGIRGRPSIYTQVSSYMGYINAYTHLGPEESAEA